jgi:hypothetical protein
MEGGVKRTALKEAYRGARLFLLAMSIGQIIAGLTLAVFLFSVFH